MTECCGIEKKSIRSKGWWGNCCVGWGGWGCVGMVNVCIYLNLNFTNSKWVFEMNKNGK